MDDEELRQLWKACDECGMYGTVAELLLLLTGQRLRKVAHLQWDDLDSNGGWTSRLSAARRGTPAKSNYRNWRSSSFARCRELR